MLGIDSYKDLEGCALKDSTLFNTNSPSLTSNLCPKTVLTATLGTILEWAEYTFFAYMADQLANHFFSIDDPDVARLKTFGIFATSYFMRPLGAILFGTLGDKRGRKPALMLSMMLMCFATTTIGCLPTYESIGITSAILLMLCRMLQGVAVAGEFNGAAVFMIEHSAKRPFLAGSLVPFSAAFGMGVGAFAATLVSAPTAPSWAWRIPFLCSGFMGLLAVYIRMALQETPVFKAALASRKPSRFPLAEVLKKDALAFWATLAMGMFISVYVYTGNIYYKILCIKVGKLSPVFAAEIITLGQWLAAGMILLCGYLAERTNGKKMCLTGLMLAIVAGPIFMFCAQSGNTQLAILGQILYAIINGLVSAPMMTLLINQFRPEIRYTGNSFGWSISAAIFGGTALIVADMLVNQFHFPQGPGIYISLTAAITFITLAFANQKNKETDAEIIPSPA
jgi:MHS family proline/betaine transporter-like MFS transporter